MSRNPESEIPTSSRTGATATWQIVLAWVVVSVPLLWGVYQTVVRTTDLFR